MLQGAPSSFISCVNHTKALFPGNYNGEDKAGILRLVVPRSSTNLFNDVRKSGEILLTASSGGMIVVVYSGMNIASAHRRSKD
jgi:hypothetical protein